MECIFVFFFGVFIFFVMSAQGASKSRHAQVFRRIAKRYHGAFMPGGFFRKPTIRFRYGETAVTLQYMEPRRDRFGPVQVRIRWPDRSLLLEVFPDEGDQSHLQMDRPGTRFDEEFIVRSNNETTARQWLSPAVQNSIRKLRRSGINWQVYVSLIRGQLTIQKHIGINYQSLDAFILSAMEIYDQAMLGQVAGIEFVAGGEEMVCEPSKEQVEVVCRICCESIESDIVFCPRCRTPHHRDCWEYNGACSTYGCAETEYVASMDHDVLG